MKRVQIYDTTLRDGNQARGLSFSLADKLNLTRRMDDFGIDYIEGGWPNPTNQLDVDYFKEVKRMGLRNSQSAAFGSTRRPGKPCSEDVLLNALLESAAPILTIFGKSWDIHATEVIRTSLEENLAMIHESVAYLKARVDKVFYDAEHFFDGYKNNPQYALKTLDAAVQGGADCLVLCDTNGGMALTWELEQIVRDMQAHFPNVDLGIHCHNDTESAVINSLSAIRAGAVQIQGTLNGYGERCGNANLISIIPNLHFKMGIDLGCSAQIHHLTKLSRDVDQIANLSPNQRSPYVGEAAFAHKGGAHIDGVLKVQHSFEHLNPAAVGNEREFVISDQAGGALIVGRLEEVVPSLDKKNPAVGEILNLVKAREDLGYRYETAAASFELLALRQLGLFKERIKVLRYRVIEEQKEDGLMVSEASVKLEIDGQLMHKVAEGDGPVNALDNALRLAILDVCPRVAEVELANFNVRVLGGHDGSAARVRVWADFSDGNMDWQTAGVSENIITASFEALLDGINYKLSKL